MISIKGTDLYSEVIKELNYPFGNIFIFEGFIISEITRGVSFNWDDHAKLIVEDVSCYLGTNGDNLVYISNRVNSYSVVAMDWLKFFKHRYLLKNYCVISDDKKGIMGTMVEGLFFNKKIKRFNNLYTAVNWVKNNAQRIA